MKRQDRDELDQLLAGGRLGPSTREHILEQVERAHRPPPWWRRSGWMRWAPALAAGGVALYAVGNRGEPAYRVKGASTIGDATASIECSRSQNMTCSQGEFLVVRARASQPTYVMAYAEPLASRAERIWFFAGENSLLVAPGSEERALDNVVKLKSLPPGSYRIHVLLNPQPLPPDVVLRPPPQASEQIVPLEVTP